MAEWAYKSIDGPGDDLSRIMVFSVNRVAGMLASLTFGPPTCRASSCRQRRELPCEDLGVEVRAADEILALDHEEGVQPRRRGQQADVVVVEVGEEDGLLGGEWP